MSSLGSARYRRDNTVAEQELLVERADVGCACDESGSSAVALGYQQECIRRPCNPSVEMAEEPGPEPRQEPFVNLTRVKARGGARICNGAGPDDNLVPARCGIQASHERDECTAARPLSEVSETVQDLTHELRPAHE